MVFGCVFAANAMVWLLLGALAGISEAWAAVGTPRLMFGVALFAACTLAGAFARQRGVVIAALLVLLAYALWNMARAASALFAAGVWTPAVGS